MVITILVTECTAINIATMFTMCVVHGQGNNYLLYIIYIVLSCTCIYMYMSMGLTVSESPAKVYSEAGVLRLVALLVRVETAYNT